MKRFLILIISLIFLNTCTMADEIWDSWQDTNFYGKTQAVTDEDFDKAIESKKEKKNFFGFTKKSKPKGAPKGEEFSQSDETSFITESAQEYPIIIIPVELIVDEETLLPTGHYQVVGEKEGNGHILKFYQAGRLIAKISATSTRDDFGEREVNFAKCREFDDKRIEIIFGSLDFNAYSLVNIR